MLLNLYYQKYIRKLKAAKVSALEMLGLYPLLGMSTEILVPNKTGERKGRIREIRESGKNEGGNDS